MAELSEWLKVMLGEVARKDAELSRAAAEHQARSAESASHAASQPARDPPGTEPRN